MVQSLALAALTLTHRINIKEVLALSIVQGIVNAFDMPGRQSFMLEMVEDRADLSNAIAINSSMVHLARLVGPALAGIVIAATNEGWCFGIDGVSYIAVIISLLMMSTRVKVATLVETSDSMLDQLREGWTYVAGFSPVRNLLLLVGLVGLMGWPYMVLMPIFAVRVLHGGPHTLGFLMGAVGVGSLVSALMLMARRSVRGLTRVIPVAAAILGMGLVLFGLSHNFWLSMLTMFLTGFGMMQGLTASNTIIQTLVDEKMRGRVMSFYTMAFVGTAPLGSLLAGGLAHSIGAPRTVIFSGVMCVAASLWFSTQLKSIRKKMRPVYERLGIVPQRVIVAAETIPPDGQ
jgi:MFS family permease